MGKSITTLEKSSEAPSNELSPQTIVTPTPASFTEPVPQFLEEDEEDDMSRIIFDWKHDNATAFIQRGKMSNTQANELNNSFELPASLQNLYGLLLKEFADDIYGTSVLINTVIQCAPSNAAVLVTARMQAIELWPWVSPIIDGELPESAKFANLFVATTVHKSKPVKLEVNSFRIVKLVDWAIETIGKWIYGNSKKLRERMKEHVQKRTGTICQGEINDK